MGWCVRGAHQVEEHAWRSSRGTARAAVARARTRSFIAVVLTCVCLSMGLARGAEGDTPSLGSRCFYNRGMPSTDPGWLLRGRTGRLASRKAHRICGKSVEVWLAALFVPAHTHRLSARFLGSSARRCRDGDEAKVGMVRPGLERTVTLSYDWLRTRRWRRSGRRILVAAVASARPHGGASDPSRSQRTKYSSWLLNIGLYKIPRATISPVDGRVSANRSTGT